MSSDGPALSLSLASVVMIIGTESAMVDQLQGSTHCEVRYLLRPDRRGRTELDSKTILI